LSVVRKRLKYRFWQPACVEAVSVLSRFWTNGKCANWKFIINRKTWEI